MGARAQEAVFCDGKLTDPDLIRLLGVLAIGANDDTGVIDPAPTRETLAALTDCKTRTITNRIHRLIALGRLEQVRLGSGPGKPSAYRLLIPIQSETVLRKGEKKGEKGESTPERIDRLEAEMGEIKALLFTLLERMGEMKGEKGEKGESERVKEGNGKGESIPPGSVHTNLLEPEEDKITRVREGENEYENLKAAVCTVTKKSILLLEESDLFKLDQLFKAGYTAGQVNTCYSKTGWWFIVWWKGLQRKQHPTIQDIVDTIGQAVEWTPGTAAPAATGNRGYQLYNDEVVPFLNGRKPFSELSRSTQDAIKAIGESNVRRLPADVLQRRFASLVIGH